MCLMCKDEPVVRHTTKERVFYKVLAIGIKMPLGESNLYTPFMSLNVTIGKRYCQNNADTFHYVKDYQYNQFNEKTLRGYTIENGGYHLYKRKKDADDLCDYLNNKYRTNKYTFNDYFVVKAIVPKGTAYVSGEYRDAKCVITKKVRYEYIGEEI